MILAWVRPPFINHTNAHTHTNSITRDHALLALAEGKHVLVEKPVACTAADAEAIVKEVNSCVFLCK